jgi:hypothetical protein
VGKLKIDLIDAVICDESQKLKNTKTTRIKILSIPLKNQYLEVIK